MIKTFKTRREAREHLAAMVGWRYANAVKIEGYPGWVIRVGEVHNGRYLRDDGWVR
jgi:hypothetical protein